MVPDHIPWEKPDIREKMLGHISQVGSDITFTHYFWKGCEPDEYELKRYRLYAESMLLLKEGRTIAGIARTTGVKANSVRKWTRFEQKPKLAYYLGLYIQLGKPREAWVWLSVDNSSGHAIPFGPFVQVPKSISSWKDVSDVILQLSDQREETEGFPNEYIFGFLLGMVIGDCAKSMSSNWHRHLGLVLSKKYASNESIGEFTSFCARSLGLRMHRVSDQPKPERKPHGFYQWVSQASPLIDWFFNIGLGLRDGERTTYDAVRMDWTVDTPENFRRGLVQGIAESDGSVSIASQTVESWIGPNWDFFKKILRSLGVASFQNREALSVTKNQIRNLAKIPPFAPHLKTVRWVRFEKLAKAGHIGHGKRVPPEIRDYIKRSDKDLSVPQLSEKVLDEFGVLLSFETVQRWAKKRAN